MTNSVTNSDRDPLVKRLFKLWATLLLTVVAACALLALVHAGLRGAAPFDPSFITIDGEPLAPSRWLGGQGLAALGALLLGAALLLLVVPLVVVQPPLLVVGVLVAVLVLLAVLAGVLTLLCSPVVRLAAVVWLMWRLAHLRAEPVTGVVR